MLERTLGRYADQIYCIARFVVGMMYWMHGTTKLFSWPPDAFGTGRTLAPFSLLWTAGWIETIGGLLIMIGLFARPAAFICSGEMAFAYFLRQFPFAVLPIYPPPGIFGESAVFNCFFFLYVAAKGAGPLSIDRWREKGRGSTAGARAAAGV